MTCRQMFDISLRMITGQKLMINFIQCDELFRAISKDKSKNITVEKITKMATKTKKILTREDFLLDLLRTERE